MINGIRLTNYYIIKYAGNDTLHNDIESLFWTENSGLVAYKCGNGYQYVKKDTAAILH